jgi:Zn-dependent protease with chaperone function
MDFFESQDQARKRTGLLVVLFIAATVAIVFLVCFAFFVAIHFSLLFNPQLYQSWIFQEQYKFLALVGAIVLFMILAVTFFKVMQLRNNGGFYLAQTLGGELVDPDTTNTTERRLLNVVEEMSIASGLPVPPVLMLRRERGINAFAAGFSASDAVIGVTRGAVELLSRDELQGVIAHEFSHIINGDMRMNVTLIGVIHGILFVSLAGKSFFRSSPDSERGQGIPPIQLFALGLMLIIIGSLGALFGSLIKAAVSRQREYLADASAVQYTRYPLGLAGALKKIGGLKTGSKVFHRNAPMASHMFFSQGVPSFLESLWSTHPDLNTRIKKLDPSWEGALPKIKELGREPGWALDQVSGFAPVVDTSGAEPEFAEPLPADEMIVADKSAVDQVGRVNEAHLIYSAELLRSMPETLHANARRPYTSRALIYGLLIDRKPEIAKSQLSLIAANEDQEISDLTKTLLPDIQKIKPQARLSLIDLTLPSLRRYYTQPAHVDGLKKNLEALIRADKKVAMFEWVLYRVVIRHLQRQLAPGKNLRPKYHSLDSLKDELSILLSALARSGSLSPVEVDHAFQAGARHIKIPGIVLKSETDSSLAALGKALNKLNQAAPTLKRKMLLAAEACICVDRCVSVSEGELLRAIADSLDCPMPPLLPGEQIKS